ncbi:hypothetical protein AB0L74_14995 [Streptomyces sp. NPDC052020]|uniref:hypothetical protein n=1 Tax=Streptomyces sp. NPDC052020 TaxID=3155677 RepID=UPI0034426EB5
MVQLSGGAMVNVGFVVWLSNREAPQDNIFVRGDPYGMHPPVLAQIVEFTARHPWLTGGFMSALVTLLGGAVFSVGRGIGRRSRRHFVTIIRSPAELAGVPFVLYLRSFTDDPARRKGDINTIRGVGGMLGDLTLSPLSEEEQLAAVLAKVAPMVAVGRPGEPLPEVGAGRMYLPLDAWQEPVRELMRQARLVVLALGPGPGTMWELVEAVRLVPRERLVLLVPLEREGYEEFRQAFREESRARYGRTVADLPDHPPKPDGLLAQGRLGIKSLIYFSAEGEATFVLLDQVRAGHVNQAYKRFEHALGPVLRRAADQPRRSRRGRR